MENTIIAVYDSKQQAESAVNELLASGFSPNDVRMNPEHVPAAAGTTGTTDTGAHGIGHFFRTLFGMEEETAPHSDVYAEAVRRGSTVLLISVDNDERRDRAADLMNRYGPINIDERAAHWRSQGWSAYDATAPMLTDEQIEQERSMYTTAGAGAAPAATEGAKDKAKIPVVQEELKVGKRVVQRGGVQIFQHVAETPVHEEVQLRQEHVKVERHPVDQPATEAYLAAFKEGSVEMREQAEEPVVEKTARVVEEVVVSKEVTEETARIDDTLRRTEVEVQRIAADEEADYRRHWQTAYGTAGGRYEDYDAAYRYGSSVSGTERFRNYRWEDVEPDVRRDWESSHPGSTWDKVKDAVRYAVERVRH